MQKIRHLCLRKLFLPSLTHFLFVSLDFLCVRKRLYPCRCCALQSGINNLAHRILLLAKTVSYHYSLICCSLWVHSKEIVCVQMFCTSSMSFGYSFIFIENWALHSKSYCNGNWTALTLGACKNILVCQIFSLVANVRAVKVQLLYDLECNIFVFVLYLYFNHI